MNTEVRNNSSRTGLLQPIDPQELPLISESSGSESPKDDLSSTSLRNDEAQHTSMNVDRDKLTLTVSPRSKNSKPEPLEKNLSEFINTFAKKPNLTKDSINKGNKNPKNEKILSQIKNKSGISKPKKKVFGLKPTNLVRPTKIEEDCPQDKVIVELLEIIQRDNSMFKPEVPLDFAFQTLSQALAMNKKNKKPKIILKPVKKQQTFSLNSNFEIRTIEALRNGEEVKDPSIKQLESDELLFDVNEDSSMSPSLSLSSDEEKIDSNKKSTKSKAETQVVKRYTKDGREKKKPGPKRKENASNQEKKKAKKPSELELINAARILMGLPQIRRGRGRPKKNKVSNPETAVPNKHSSSPPVIETPLMPQMTPHLLPQMNPAVMAHVNPSLLSQMNLLLLNNLFSKPGKTPNPEVNFRVKVLEESTH